MGAYVSTNNLYNSVSTKILLKIYPYFHNKNDIELSSNLCKLVMSNQNKFKEYLIYILQKTSKICKLKLKFENLYFDHDVDADGYEYFIIEIIFRLEEDMINSEILKQSFILAIHEDKNKVEFGNDIYLKFRENDIVNINISQIL
jgi:hypothetical protein